MTSQFNFKGLPKNIFDSCDPSSKINIVRVALENLRIFIEPDIKKMSVKLNGKVSEAKQRTMGGVEWTDWAWLMFTLAPLGDSNSSRPGKPVGASALSQLTVNVSKDRIYVGFLLKKYSDGVNLRKELLKPENEELFLKITHSLSGRRWIITQKNEEFYNKEARFYSAADLRGKLLDPHLRWINTDFSRSDQAVYSEHFAEDIIRIIKELYNIFSLATCISQIEQPSPFSSPPKLLDVLKDEPMKETASDDDEISNTLTILEKIKIKEMPKRISISGKIDSYPVERSVLPLDLRLITLEINNEHFNFWVDTAYAEEDIKNRIKLVVEFKSILDRISKSIDKSPDFIQIMVTSKESDARYTNSNIILTNLVRYETNKNIIFWLFAIAREIAYICYKRLSYGHVNLMRKILILSLSKL